MTYRFKAAGVSAIICTSDGDVANQVELAAEKTDVLKTKIIAHGKREGWRSFDAESRMFRSWGADIINMSIATETIMANELGVPYAAVAMSTDYDSWKEDDTVTWEAILAVAQANAEKVLTLFKRVIPRLT